MSLRIADRLKMKTTTTKEMGKGEERKSRERESSSEKVRVPMRRVTGVWSGALEVFPVRLWVFCA